MHQNFVLIIFLIFYFSSSSFSQSVEELVLEDGNTKPMEGQNVTFICKGIGDHLQWQHKRHVISSNSSRRTIETLTSSENAEILESKLHITKLNLKDSGKYRCLVKKEDNKNANNISLHVQAPPLLQETRNYTGQSSSDAILSCTVRAVPAPQITWRKGEEVLLEGERYLIEERSESFLHISTLSIKGIHSSDNGSYLCLFENSHGRSNATTTILIEDPPEIESFSARSMESEKLTIQYQLKPNNLPVNYTQLMVLLPDSDELSIDMDPFDMEEVGMVSLDRSDLPMDSEGNVLKEFQVVLVVTNMVGAAESEVVNVTMKEKTPEYVPEVFLRGSTKDSLSVSWTQPDGELHNHVDFYRLSLSEVGVNNTINTIRGSNYSDYFFQNLNHGTMYKFTIETCMKDIKECSPKSGPVSGRTLALPPPPVSDVIVTCHSNRTDGVNWVYVEWVPPQDINDIDKYKIDLKASAHFINEFNRTDYYNNITVQKVSADHRNFTFNNVEPNTNYTVKVYSGSKNLFSSSLLANCETPFWLPRPTSHRWWKSKVNKKTVLKLAVPRVSQRNGTICCHRVVVIRLNDNRTFEDLPMPKYVPILPFFTAKHITGFGGYVAEAFPSKAITSKYLLVGDGELTGNWSAECARCIGVDPMAAAAREQLAEGLSAAVDEDGNPPIVAALPYTQSLRRRSPELPPIAEDGQLSKDSNYTGFLIMTVRAKDGSVLTSYSDYFNVIQPVDDPIHHTSTSPAMSPSLTHVVYILGTLIILLLLMAVSLGFLLCHYHNKRKQLLDEGIEESLSGSLGRIFRTMRRSHTLMSQPGIDVAPIQKDLLVAEYLDKIKDSELGFRREFEALPEKFYDRSSRSSEMTESACKNRYPDIKAYDQTRVKLSQLNGIVGSDYINANYVMGYKERKKFICAQGPMEATVNDFWRMIVEQRSSLCIMLTNLEETGKVKCVKYWPEAGEPKTFGNITVRLVKEKLYADYIVRTLRAEWTVSSASNGSGPSSDTTATKEKSNGAVVESGTATTKSNSSACNSTSVTTNSNYNSLSSNSGCGSEEVKCHEVQQYHYLVWKDFVAPEHPVGLLSFLRRINDAYSPDLGPLLVHCSAGVGRTGTLVALDTLVTELDEERQASIYNIICDLRHQRNFLVQSLKQYVFVHRALMEHAQFGNTELSLAKLKENYNRQMESDGEEQLHLRKEYERLTKVIEDRKAFTVANSESNRAKNRYDFVLPYDTNCVILTPIATQIGATYINASFLTGFDLGENFIVTQDPLENTAFDFWRMIYEQEVCTIVMLSELGSGENHCSKYWPDEEESHDHITVTFLSSESYPKYSTRSFRVRNTKNNDSVTVTQFHYVGWSGSLGEVPLVTHGIMEVITRVQTHNDANLANLSSLSSQPPTVVHCSGGGDRSSVYVCLNNCLRQLRRENCVDVFQTARKIRSQRQYQLQDFAQYEFVYKALVEYVDIKRGENL